MSRTTDAFASGLGVFLVLCLVLALPVGWCMNLYKLAYSDFTTVEPVEVLRCAGVVVPPIGGVVGWF